MAHKKQHSARAVGDSFNFTAFTATTPTVATAESAGELAQGDVLTLAAVAGDPAAMAAIDGASAEVSMVSGNEVTLMLDLSAVDVTGLAGTGTVTSEGEGPAPSPEPPPEVVTVAQMLTRYPSPGVGVMPVDVNPADTPAGMSSLDDAIPNPENPTGPPLEGAARAKFLSDFKQRQERSDKLTRKFLATTLTE